jgi:hypothetical protein
MQWVSTEPSHMFLSSFHSHSYLMNFSSFIAQFPSKHASHHPPPSIVSDLKWWLSMLSTPPTPCTLTMRGPPKYLDLWVDASTDWGIGIIIGSKLNAWTLHLVWKNKFS